MSFQFPDALPAAITGSLVARSVDPWITDAAEVGAGRRRKRYTRSLKGYTYKIVVSQTQLDELHQFYDDDLDGGVSSFLWVHPVSKVVLNVQFDERPKEMHRSANIYDVEIKISEI